MPTLSVRVPEDFLGDAVAVSWEELGRVRGSSDRNGPEAVCVRAYAAISDGPAAYVRHYASTPALLLLLPVPARRLYRRDLGHQGMQSLLVSADGSPLIVQAAEPEESTSTNVKFIVAEDRLIVAPIAADGPDSRTFHLKGVQLALCGNAIQISDPAQGSFVSSPRLPLVPEHE